MNTLALTLVIVIWFPIAVVTIYNLFWDVRFWQMQDYRFNRMLQHLRWDFAISHRKPIYTILKLIVFVLAVTFTVFPGALAPMVGVLLGFAVWVSEVMDIGSQILRHRFPYLQLSVRNTLILVTGIIGLGLLPVLLSLYLLASNPPELSIAGANLLPIVTSGGIEIIPLTYIFLVFSTLLGIVYDLGSPIISMLLVLVTSPLAWLEKIFYVAVAKLFLARHRSLIVIAVAGSYSKTTTKQILEFVLKEQYQVATSQLTQTSLSKLALDIITNLRPRTQVLLAEINAYRPGEAAAMTKLLQPQIVLLTGIDESHAVLFGSMENALKSTGEIVKQLKPRSTVIYNGNDQLLNSIAGKYDNKEVFYFTTHDPHSDLTDNQLEVDDYHAQDVKVAKQRLTFTLLNQTREIKIQAPAEAKAILNSLLGAAATAAEAGISLDRIAAGLANLPDNITKPELIAGDNGTLLINDERPLTRKGLENLLSYLQDTAAPQKIVVTTGITELGKYKHDVYADMADAIQSTTNVVISYDKHLIESLQHNNSNLQTNFVDNIDELIYAVRMHATEGAVILLAGNLEPGIVAALRDE